MSGFKIFETRKNSFLKIPRYLQNKKVLIFDFYNTTSFQDFSKRYLENFSIRFEYIQIHTSFQNFLQKKNMISAIFRFRIRIFNFGF